MRLSIAREYAQSSKYESIFFFFFFSYVRYARVAYFVINIESVFLKHFTPQAAAKQHY